MSKIKIPGWIICDANTGEAVCQRCGAREKFPEFPLPITAFVKWSEYFGEKHKYCEEKKG